MQDFQTLSTSSNLLKISAQLALVHQRFYGRSLSPIAVGSASVSVQFETLAACEVAIELNLRCAGLEFELQLVDPEALFELGAALVPGVPLRLQAAAFLHAAQPIWQALEKVIGLPIQLVRIAGAKAAAFNTDGLGMLISFKDRLGGESQRSGAVVRALQPEGWQRILAGAKSRLVSDGRQPDLHFAMPVVVETIDITWQELTQLAVGDVLLLDAGANTLGSETVYLVLGDAPIGGVQAKRVGSRLQITQVDFFANKTAMHAGNLWNGFMTIDDNGKKIPEEDSPRSAKTYQGALDDVLVDVQLELGRLSLPISTLRGLAVGQVFDTQKPLDGESVLLSCGGRQLGVGQLIAIGERLGVRITALQLLASECVTGDFAESTAKKPSSGSSSALDTK